ncbi:hypothetical protein FRB99_006489 [Tulasnella sp. 403]|nr:hypothetical protein FRB99_006489 [Tulasnella sp. 403]
MPSSLNSSAPASRAHSPAPGSSGVAHSSSMDSVSESSPNSNAQPRRANPLIDLIDSEKEYVDRLAGIIRKVASAWSRANFPPPELDAMFRAVEAVYRASRSFLGKLKEIGPNPSSPKALGDLLMRWIEDLDTPYSRYCSAYVSGFDVWERVQSNPSLGTLLVALSDSLPPPSTSSSDGAPVWTLDSLFDLPRLRIKYYKKLYARLLKSTQPGRSDHRLLVGANERLDTLLALVTSRMEIRVGVTDAVEPGQEDFRDEPPPQPSESPMVTQPLKRPSLEAQLDRTSVTSSVASDPRVSGGRIPGSVSSSSTYVLSLKCSTETEKHSTRPSDRLSKDNTGNERLSRETATTSMSGGRSPSAMSNRLQSPTGTSRTSLPTPSVPGSPPLATTRSVAAVQESLDTTQVLDIFTMTPKPCKLQIANPANPLPFIRSVKFEVDVEVAIVPRATGQEVVYPRAHIIMLTDLCLVCEWMEAVTPNESTTLWLRFPPLAARLLTVEDPHDAPSNTFLIHVLRKETLIIRTPSPSVKQRLIGDFLEAVDSAAKLMPSVRPAPGPIPPSGPGPSLPTVPPIMLPDPSQNGAPIAPRSPLSTQSFYENGTAPSNLLSPRNSESGVPNQFSRMGFGGASDGSLPLANESPATAPGMFLPPPRSASYGNVPQSHNQPPPQSQAPFPPLLHGAPRFGPGQAPQFPPGPPRPTHPGTPGQNPTGPPPPNKLRKSPSGRSLGSTRSGPPVGEAPLPPIPGQGPNNFMPGPIPGREPRPGMGLAPQQYPYTPNYLPPRSRSQPPPAGPDDFDSPPASPVEEAPTAITGPAVISAQMKCKVFLKQQHAQWKSIGGAHLKLFEQKSPPVKQLVVEADSKSKEILISTIVLTDGVERVGRTGVAIELSDKGVRTGIVYMIQLRNETAASGLFNSLLAGSDRTARSRN